MATKCTLCDATGYEHLLGMQGMEYDNTEWEQPIYTESQHKQRGLCPDCYKKLVNNRGPEFVHKYLLGQVEIDDKILCNGTHCCPWRPVQSVTVTTDTPLYLNVYREGDQLFVDIKGTRDAAYGDKLTKDGRVHPMLVTAGDMKVCLRTMKEW